VPQERIDRRVRRTRELLRNALTSLILEEGYERVTVQDICDRADVGRSTFYAHFQDKEELLLSGFDGLQEDLRQAFADHEQQTPARQTGSGSWAALAVIEHLADYRAVSSMLGRRGSAVAIARLRRILSELLRDHLQVQLDPTTSTRVPMEVAVEFAVASLLGLIDWWLDHDRPYPPEQLEGMYRRLTEPGIRAALRPA
jgi:AcrR family transcriptional regulator